MKTIKGYAFLIAIAMSLVSCSTQKTNQQGHFKILPTPQEYQITGVSKLNTNQLKFAFAENNDESPLMGTVLKDLELTDKEDSAQINYSINTELDLPDQGYLLQITDELISIIGKDQAGLFYGFKTLEQLIVDAEDQKVNLPLCRIKDYPLLTYRSIHIDVKHHLDKVSYYYQLFDKLSSYKINAIIIEFEDKIKFERHPKIASSDALSKEEWQQLSTYAKERHIEISPLMQGLGHSSFVLKHDQYKHLRDDPNSDWAYNPLDPETYQLQFDLYDEALEATPFGKYLHVGGDEVHTTGKNSGKSALELQLEWLNKVSQYAEEHDRIPIFWDDMPLKHADVYQPIYNTDLSKETVDQIWNENEPKLLEFLNQFPKNCIYMRWNYHTPQSYGNSKAMDWFRNHNFEVMGATAGQTRWVLMPQRESNIDNIKSFALSSIKSGLNGLLLTLWDDDSPHFELYTRGILAFSEYTWSGDKLAKNEFKSVYRHREFGNKLSSDDFAFIDQLEGPVAQWQNLLLDGNHRKGLISDPKAIKQLVIDMPDSENFGAWSKQYADRIKQAKQTVERCDSITTKIKSIQELSNRNTYNLKVYQQVTNIVKFSNQALLKLYNYDRAQGSIQQKEALDELKDLEGTFNLLRTEFEAVYSKTRILNKPKDYLLDQDHHKHLANQSVSFDWQFYAELLFLEKLKETVLK